MILGLRVLNVRRGGDGNLLPGRRNETVHVETGESVSIELFLIDENI